MGAGTRCLNHCAIERECPYFAKRLYLEHPQRWTNNIWHDSGLKGDISPAAGGGGFAHARRRAFAQCWFLIADDWILPLGLVVVLRKGMGVPYFSRVMI